MQTRLHLFAIASLACLSLTSICAMEQPAAPKYRLVRIARSEGVNGMVTCVKKISDKYLIFLNNNGTGLLFDLTDNYKRIKQWRFTDGFDAIHHVKNIFIYQDLDSDQPLLIAHNDCKNSLHVCRLDSKFETYGPIYINHIFKLVQAIVESKKILVIVNSKDSSAFSIDLTWASMFPAKLTWEDLNPKSKHKEELVQIKLLHDFSIDNVIEEGLLVDHSTYQDNWKQFGLATEIFDIQSLTKEEKDWVACYYRDQNGQMIEKIKKIYCYHKASDGTFYLGHDGGFVTVWEPISHNYQEL